MKTCSFRHCFAVYIHKHRASVVKQLLSTEKTYCSNLSELVKVGSLGSLLALITVKTFISPIASHKLLDEQTQARLFTNLPQLADFHAIFVTKLAERMKMWSPRQQIGDIFSELVGICVVIPVTPEDTIYEVVSILCK